MTTGVRTVLGVLVLPLAALAVVASALGMAYGRPPWWLAGLVAALNAFVLMRVVVAAAGVRGAAALLAPWTGLLAVAGGLWGVVSPVGSPEPAPLLLGAVIGLGGLAAFVGGRYAADTADLPEGEALARWARLTLWALGVALCEQLLVVVGWSQPALVSGVVRVVSLLVMGVGVEILVGLRGGGPQIGAVRGVDLVLLRWVLQRWNPLASLGDAVQASLGVDLRTTWAIQFLRAAVAPMAVAVALLGWLCSGLVRVGPEEVAIHERLGRPVTRTALGPGLHVVAPWPIDRLRRVPIRRVLTMPIGAEEHEGGEEDDDEGHEAPEDTLWARMHAEEEYTLLLGDGRDLVTLDGLLHYRIADPFRYVYGAQNPEEGLQAAAYEALTRRTVGRSLDGVLSENLSSFADEVVGDIRVRSAELDLGLEPVSFTLKGLHPPFAVAKDYQSVVSAQIRQQTETIRARAYRLRLVPQAHAAATEALDSARAARMTARAEAVGEAEAFRSLVGSYTAAPALFRFRRRMETLEANLEGRELIVIDGRFERQGGDLWLIN